ncbi:hypothetical protein D8S78_08745 [Natrialba swarupiae]|nr:hypothetical protein [Natrialba swarupiae]
MGQRAGHPLLLAPETTTSSGFISVSGHHPDRTEREESRTVGIEETIRSEPATSIDRTRTDTTVSPGFKTIRLGLEQGRV